MNFFKTLAMVGLVILFGIGCYIAGGINVGKLENKMRDQNALIWIRSINRAIELKKYEVAEKYCYDAASLYFVSLYKSESWKSTFPYLFPFFCKEIYPKEDSLFWTLPKEYYLLHKDKLMPEARMILDGKDPSPTCRSCK